MIRLPSKTTILLKITSANVRTLLSDQQLIEFEEELETIKWDIVGLGEVRKRGENHLILKSEYRTSRYN